MAALGVAALTVSPCPYHGHDLVGTSDRLFLAYARHAPAITLLAFVSERTAASTTDRFRSARLVASLLGGRGSVPSPSWGHLHLWITRPPSVRVIRLCPSRPPSLTRPARSCCSRPKPPGGVSVRGRHRLFATLFTVLALVALRKGRTGLFRADLVPALSFQRDGSRFPLLASSSSRRALGVSVDAGACRAQLGRPTCCVVAGLRPGGIGRRRPSCPLPGPRRSSRDRERVLPRVHGESVISARLHPRPRGGDARPRHRGGCS